MSEPAVSIVMPCFEQARFVEEAVTSVLEQAGVDAELLVMDPGSADGSRDLVMKLVDRYGDRLVPCFQPDAGQSDAVNVGMERARGRVLGWLNSDDRLRPGALCAVVDELADCDGPAWLYGTAGMIGPDGGAISSWVARYKDLRGRRFSRYKLLTENFIPQMAVFWNRQMWEAAGPLDPELHLDMDYDQWFRFARRAAPVVLRRSLADFRVHGDAKGSRQTNEQLDAALATARRYAGELGIRGKLALMMHRACSARTRLLYRWLKP